MKIKKCLPFIFLSLAMIIFSIVLAFMEISNVARILIFIALILSVISNFLLILNILRDKTDDVK